MDYKHTLHLLNRATMGATIAEVQKFSGFEKDKLIEHIFAESKSRNPLELEFSDLPEKKDLQNLSQQEKKELRKKLKDKVIELNVLWLKKLITGKNSLSERMTFFWHNHFACRDDNPITLLELNNIHREYAFAPFKQLLLAVAKSPAMLQFLNNQQNRKAHPNENFARELMELFTIGRGNYTEQDIKEAARAFTGWAFNRETMEFEFRDKHHDYDTKQFMGKIGNFDGEDIIDILLSKKETAYFICKKIYKHFVNDVPDEKHIADLADSYFANNYNTEMLMRHVFSSTWFYDNKNIGSLIKSPVELIVGLSKSMSIQYSKPEMLLYIQKALGQILFYPPNVAGWPGGKNWIDSSTLMYRLRLPSLLANGGIIDIEMKEDMPEEFMGKMNDVMQKQQNKVEKKTGSSVNWQNLESSFANNTSTEKLVTYFIACNLSSEKLNLVEDNSLREKIMKIVSLPEYQLY